MAKGVPLTIKLNVLDTGNGATGLKGAAVYLWHCDIDGKYSLYSEGITEENSSQLALPEDANTLVYATAGYSTSVRNLAQTSLATDNVFSDGYSLQLATVTGSVEDGFTATLNVPV